jgi:hypothetical protein
MPHLIPFIRQPVQRQGAPDYLLITLLSFAISVIVTRLFLNLTGYPKLGQGEFHIAHVLWGGILLFVAALLPLIFANRWVYQFGAALAGTGVGLFIDEIGKFITQSNDYFYPLAAPIIYAFFLLTVFVYLQVRSPRPRDARAELYRSLDTLEEVLESDLDAQERTDLQARLTYVAQSSDNPALARLANDLLDFLSCDTLPIAPTRTPFLERYFQAWLNFQEKHLSRQRLKAILGVSLLTLGALALYRMIQALPFGEAVSLERTLLHLINDGVLRGPGGLSWFAARLALETSVGVLLVFSAILLVLNGERLALALASLGLLLSLTTVDLLIFYFDQFSTILIALAQLWLLMMVINYRYRFVQEKGAM